MITKKKNSALMTFYGFLILFSTLLVSSTASIFMYYYVTKRTSNVFVVAISVLSVIILSALICTLIDIQRRKIMIEKPVDKILYATHKIASGDFSIKIEHNHEYSSFDEFDVIFDNINTMASELAKNELLKNDFISNVSHEIKTPLSVIQNYAKLLQNEKISAEKRSEYLNGLIIQTNKLSNLISNILKLNKLENQKIIPEIETFSLSELLEKSALSFESLIEKKQLQLKCDIDNITITSSPTLLEIVFNNLISNAIKFTGDGGKITISLKNENNYVAIKVKDTGCGISSETGKHIFDKFYQGDTSHSSEGNGLGLALVKKVIDTLGGEISVESKLSKGTTFTIKLKKDILWTQ